MKNALVVAAPMGSIEVEKAVVRLKGRNILDPKVWIAHAPPSEDGLGVFFNFSYFETRQWIDAYREPLKAYARDLEADFAADKAFYERFMEFMTCYSHHDAFHSRGPYHYLDMFNLLRRFFLGLLVKEKIEVVWFAAMPHVGYDNVIYEAAKFLGLKTLVTAQSQFPNKFFYMEDIQDFGTFSFMRPLSGDDFELRRNEEPKWFYMNHHKTFRPSLAHVLGRPVKYALLRALKRPYRHSHTGEVLLADSFRKYMFEREYARDLATRVEPVDYGRNYVYFPLHLQPEMTTAPIGGIFLDQALALEKLSRLLPGDWCIYVKENPAQSEFMRGNLFFERLDLLKNVKIVSRRENSYRLIRNSQFVATITGTAGWEALLAGKPALVFGNAWYQTLPGVFKYRDGFRLAEVTDWRETPGELQQAFNALYRKLGNGVVEAEYREIIKDYSLDRNAGLLAQTMERLIRMEQAAPGLPGPPAG